MFFAGIGTIVSLVLIIFAISLMIILKLTSKKQTRNLKENQQNQESSFLNLFEKDKKAQQKIKIETCETCGAVIEIIDGTGVCPYCGAKKSKK